MGSMVRLTKFGVSMGEHTAISTCNNAQGLREYVGLIGMHGVDG